MTSILSPYSNLNGWKLYKQNFVVYNILWATETKRIYLRYLAFCIFRRTAWLL